MKSHKHFLHNISFDTGNKKTKFGTLSRKCTILDHIAGLVAFRFSIRFILSKYYKIFCGKIAHEIKEPPGYYSS